jgi:FkbM family methyltransferase
MDYNSQLGQDRFINEFFDNKQNGFFVDIGAHEGITYSNTYFLEKYRDWKGICIEPLPVEFKELEKNRTAIKLNLCVSDFDGETDFTYVEGYANMLSGISEAYNNTHRERIHNEVNQYGGKIHDIKVPVKKLQTIFDEFEVKEVDFCSIDTEGSEFNIVKSIDFEKTLVKIFIIENNYQESTIAEFLSTKDYVLYTKLHWDDVFIKKEYIK